MSVDLSRYKKDFPILTRKVRGGNRLIYLDSGATSQKPESVIKAESDFYRTINSAVHRGAHLLAEEASEAYEGARENLAKFLGAKTDEVIFTKSATESLNMIAYSLGNANSSFNVKSGDEIVVSQMEHHANLIPWQQLAKRTGAKLVWFSITDDGRLDLSNIDQIINKRTKIVAITHQSNVFGTIIPLREIVKAAHEVGAVVVLDACQSAPHFAIDVKDLEVELDVLREAGHGEVAGADEGDRADDCNLRVRDVGFGVEFSLGVGAALDLAVAKGLNYGRRAGEEIVLLFLGFEAGVQLLGYVPLKGLENCLARARRDLVAHEDANLFELLPLAIKGEQSADLEVAGCDVKRTGDLGPILEVAKSFPLGLAIVHDKEFAARFMILSHSRHLSFPRDRMGATTGKRKE